MTKDARRNYNVVRGCLFGVGWGGPAFEVATNLCDYFELGAQQGNGHWLKGEIVKGEFLFNGRLFARGQDAGTIIDNFPKSTPQGWTRRQRPDGNGYELVGADETILFGYRVDNNICHITTNIFDASGEIVAETSTDEFRLYQPPATIGRGGIRWA